jgi:hypothetical protein
MYLLMTTTFKSIGSLSTDAGKGGCVNITIVDLIKKKTDG